LRVLINLVNFLFDGQHQSEFLVFFFQKFALIRQLNVYIIPLFQLLLVNLNLKFTLINLLLEGCLFSQFIFQIVYFLS